MFKNYGNRKLFKPIECSSFQCCAFLQIKILPLSNLPFILERSIKYPVITIIDLIGYIPLRKQFAFFKMQRKETVYFENILCVVYYEVNFATRIFLKLFNLHRLFSQKKNNVFLAYSYLDLYRKTYFWFQAEFISIRLRR